MKLLEKPNWIVKSYEKEKKFLLNPKEKAFSQWNFYVWRLNSLISAIVFSLGQKSFLESQPADVEKICLSKILNFVRNIRLYRTKSVLNSVWTVEEQAESPSNLLIQGVGVKNPIFGSHNWRP